MPVIISMIKDMSIQNGFLNIVSRILPKLLKACTCILIGGALLASCLPSRKFSQTLPDGEYVIKQENKKETGRAYSYNDTLYLEKNKVTTTFSDYVASLQRKEIFIRHSFDIDAFTTPFKFRPGVDGVPTQFNSALNGAVYLGYRSDHYTFRNIDRTSSLEKKYNQKLGYGIGGFFGMGAAALNGRLLRNVIDYEYDGFILEYGTALLISYGSINTGIAVGADNLVDKYRKDWIYQNKPWIGILLGINLN